MRYVLSIFAVFSIACLTTASLKAEERDSDKADAIQQVYQGSLTDRLFVVETNEEDSRESLAS